MEELLTKKELAEKLKVSVITIERLRKDGLPDLKVGRQVRFKLSQVMEFIEKGSKY